MDRQKQRLLDRLLHYCRLAGAVCLCRTRNYVFQMPCAKRKAPLSAHCSYAADDRLQRALLFECGLAAPLVRRYCRIPKCDVYSDLWFCQYHLTHFIRTRIMQRERYDHSRAFFELPEADHRWRCRFFCWPSNS